MALRKRKKTRRRRRKGSLEAEGYSDAAVERLRSIAESTSYEFAPEERDEVETRIRNMWYGAKREGSRSGDDDDRAGGDPT